MCNKLWLFHYSHVMLSKYYKYTKYSCVFLLYVCMLWGWGGEGTCGPSLMEDVGCMISKFVHRYYSTRRDTLCSNPSMRLPNGWKFLVMTHPLDWNFWWWLTQWIEIFSDDHPLNWNFWWWPPNWWKFSVLTHHPTQLKFSVMTHYPFNWNFWWWPTTRSIEIFGHNSWIKS